MEPSIAKNGTDEVVREHFGSVRSECDRGQPLCRLDAGIHLCGSSVSSYASVGRSASKTLAGTVPTVMTVSLERGYTAVCSALGKIAFRSDAGMFPAQP